MPELIKENTIQSVTFAEFVLGLAIVATGFLVARLISVVAGAILIILGLLVIAL